MANRADLVEAYIGALGICPLVIVALKDGPPSRIACQHQASLNAFDTLWFFKRQHVELVVSRSIADLSSIGAMRPQGWIDMHPRELRDMIVNSATMLGAKFRSMTEIQTGAEAAVDRIIADVEKARVSGGLAQVNAAYKAYRQRQIEKGETAITYSAHLTNITRNMVVLAAQNAQALASQIT